jgi:hypothetical protein
VARLDARGGRRRPFAGDDLEAAVFFPEDDRYLVEREPVVRHFEVDVNAEP